jgi:hypothetical protein
MGLNLLNEPKNKEDRTANSTTNVLAVISFVLSLLGVLATFLIPLLPQIAGIICGHIARSQIRRSEGSQVGSGMALAGLIIGYLSIVFSLIGSIFLGVGLFALFTY